MSTFGTTDSDHTENTEFSSVDSSDKFTVLQHTLRPTENRSTLSSSEPLQLLEDFADLSSDGFWQMDASLMYDYVSSRFSEITGIPANLIVGFSNEELGITEDDMDAWRKHAEVLRRRESFRDFRFTMLHPDGHTIVVSMNGDALSDEAGVFVGYRGTCTKVGESYRDANSPSIYRGTGCITTLGFWERNETTTDCTYCSEDLADMHGVSVEECLSYMKSSNRNWNWLHPDDRERYQAAEEKLEKDKESFEIEYRLLSKSGQTIDASEIVVPIVDQDNQLIRTVGFVRDITARKQAAAKLEKITNLYQKTESMAKIGHWEWDERADHSTYCSAELARLHGLTVDEYHAQTRSTECEAQLVHPDDRDYYLSEVANYLRYPSRKILEYRLLNKDGRIRDVSEVLVPIFDAENRHTRSVGSLQDVTVTKNAAASLAAARDDLEARVQQRTEELQQAVSSLKESEFRARNATRIARLGYFQWDSVAGHAVYCDEEVARTLGVPIEDCMNETTEEFLARVHPEDLSRVSKSYRASREDAAKVDIEYRIVRPDGCIRYVHEMSTTESTTDGAAIHVFGTLQDITDRKKISNELATIEERLHELGANAREVFCIISGDWKQVIYVSEAFQEIWGRSPQAVLDKASTWLDYVYPEDFDMVVSQIAAKMSGEDPTPDFSECRIVRPNGDIRWLSARVYAVLGDDGEILRFAGVAEDITERKADMDVLHQAQKMEAVGQLTGGVAHDFNNLLAVILGNAELLQGLLDHEEESMLQEIITAGNRGAELTRRLLAFSRLQPLRPAATDVVQLVANMGELLRRTLGTTISVNITADCPAAYSMVDASLLENAILNLALNARDAMPDGGELEICVSRSSQCKTLPDNLLDEDKALTITVKDNGCGMDNDILSRAMEPFFTTKSSVDGSGLGLPMVYGFVKQSNGDLFIDSEWQRGTTATIYLPHYDDEIDRNPESQLHTAAAQ